MSQYCKRFDSKETDKCAADYSKAVCWGVKVINVICINCSYNSEAEGFPLLDIKAFFCLDRSNFMQVRVFERYIPLS